MLWVSMFSFELCYTWPINRDSGKTRFVVTDLLDEHENTLETLCVVLFSTFMC